VTRTKFYTVGTSEGFIFNTVWVARGNHDRWPGMLFGGLSRRTVPKRYTERAVEVVTDVLNRVDAGEDPAPLPRGYFGFRRMLAAS
jgi:hypothetical protein